MKKIIILSGLISIIFFVLSSCDRWQSVDDKEVVARVDEFYLTIDQVKSLIPPYLSEKEKRSVSEKIVESWVVNQILYQTALQNNLTLSKIQKRYIDQLEQDYIIQNYLDVKALELRESITETAISNYYNSHLDDYLFKENNIRLTQLVFETRVKDIFNEIREVGNLNTIIQKYQLQSRPGENVINGDLGYIDQPKLTSLMNRRTRYLKIGEYTGPILINKKFVFVQVTDRKKKGDQIPLYLVEDEIKVILEYLQRQDIKENLIKKRKPDFVVETFMSRLEYGVLD